MKNVTFLLNSCDSHSEAWEPFFLLLKRMWTSLDYPIILNTETKNFEMDGLCIKTINTPVSESWSDRLMKVLDRIDTSYVLIFLEDFFLESPIDLEHYNKFLNFIINNNDVGCISFHNSPDGLVSSGELTNYALLKPNARFRASCQVALWRTDVLKKILRKHENAWEFEVWASKRSGRLPYRFYSIIPGIPEAFDYDLGKPIYRGSWNMESVTRIMKKTGVTITTESLPNIATMKDLKVTPKKCTLKDIFKRLKSIF